MSNPDGAEFLRNALEQNNIARDRIAAALRPDTVSSVEAAAVNQDATGSSAQQAAAKAAGVPLHLADRIDGDTAAELDADALKFLADLTGAPRKPRAVDPTQGRTGPVQADPAKHFTKIIDDLAGSSRSPWQMSRGWNPR